MNPSKFQQAKELLVGHLEELHRQQTGQDFDAGTVEQIGGIIDSIITDLAEAALEPAPLSHQDANDPVIDRDALVND